MKNICAFVMFLLIFFTSFFITQQVGAADVWAYATGNLTDKYEAYVVTESIRWNKSYTAMTCAVKCMRDGQLEKIVFWTFDRYSGDWRYRTSEMRKGITGLVSTSSWAENVFNVCLHH